MIERRHVQRELLKILEIELATVRLLARSDASAPARRIALGERESTLTAEIQKLQDSLRNGEPSSPPADEKTTSI